MENFYAFCAAMIGAIKNCEKKLDSKDESEFERAQYWMCEHSNILEIAVKAIAPSGGGFDRGTYINKKESRADKLFFHTSFHHMNENGYYDGWTLHKVIVIPQFDGVLIRVTGENRNNIKEYIADCFYSLVSAQVDRVALQRGKPEPVAA